MNQRKYFGIHKILETFEMTNTIVNYGLCPLSRNLSLAVKHLAIQEEIVKLLVAWLNMPHAQGQSFVE